MYNVYCVQCTRRPVYTVCNAQVYTVRNKFYNKFKLHTEFGLSV